MPINKFNTNLDLARQAEIYSGETAIFQGGIQMGIPFSGFPTGVDETTIISLGVVDTQTTAFSGTSATTVFDVINPSSPYYMVINNPLTDTLQYNYTVLDESTKTITVASTPYNPSMSYTAETGAINTSPDEIIFNVPILQKLWDDGYYDTYFDNLGIATVGTSFIDERYFNTGSEFSGASINLEVISQGVHGTIPTFVTGTTSGTVIEYSGLSRYWSNPLFTAFTSGLTLPILVESGDSQTTGYIWTLTDSTTIEENFVQLGFSGYSITYTFDDIDDIALPPNTYGNVTAVLENFSAGTLDYKGSTTWLNIEGRAVVDERLTVDRLTVVSGAQPDYILKSVDTTGNLQYEALSAITSSACSPTINTKDIYPCNTGDTISVHGDFTVNGNFYVSGTTSSTTTVIETEIIRAEDNNIELNYGGDHATAIGGGITVLSGVSNTTPQAGSIHSILETKSIGTWEIKPSASVGTGNTTETFSFTVGRDNIAGANDAVAVGRDNTIAKGHYSAILGGRNNYMRQPENTADDGGYASIMGGSGHTMEYIRSSSPFGPTLWATPVTNSSGFGNGIFGGAQNKMYDSTLSSIMGGYGHFMETALGGTIIGGTGHTLDSVNNSVILGGQQNDILDSSNYSTIVGGELNILSGDSEHSTIIGGVDNQILNHVRSTIIGGSGNTIDLDFLPSPGGNRALGLGTDETIIGSYNSNIFSSSKASIISSDGSTIDQVVGGSILNSAESTIDGVVASNSNGLSIEASNSSSITGSTKYSSIKTSVNSNIFHNGGVSNDHVSIIGSVNSDIIGNSILHSAIINSDDTSITGTGHFNLILNSNGSGANDGNIFDSAGSNLIGTSRSNIKNSSESAIFASRDSNITDNSAWVVLLGGLLNDADDAGYSSILGGENNTISSVSHSSIVGGENNIISGVDNTVILGGQNITATTSDTVYVPNLNIGTVGSG
jgi:hypothetical protein